MLDPIDEVAMANLATFKEKPIVDASKEALDLGDEDDADKAAREALAEEYKDLTDWMKPRSADKSKRLRCQTVSQTPRASW